MAYIKGNMQHQEQQHFPNFFAYLQCQQKKRPGSAASRPNSSNGRSPSRITSAANKHNSSSTTTSSRPGSPQTQLHLQGITQTQLQQQRRRSASPPHISRVSCSGSPSNNSRPASAAKARRPVSAVPNFMLAAHRLGGDSNAAATGAAASAAGRPFSAAPASRSNQQQQQQHRQGSLQQPLPASWAQQQQQQQQQRQQQQHRPPSALQVGDVGVQVHRPMSATWPAGSSSSSSSPQGRIASATNPRLQLQAPQHSALSQQWQQHQQHQQETEKLLVRPGSALPKQRPMLAPGQVPPAGGTAIAPAWLANLNPAAAAGAGTSPVTVLAALTVARISSSSGCSCSDSVATGGCRPSSPVAHRCAARFSVSSSNPDSASPASRAAAGGTAAAAAAAGSAGACSSSSGPWGAFGSDAPLVWQRVSSPDTQRYLQQQQEQHQLLQPTQQQQSAAAEGQADTASHDHKQQQQGGDHQQHMETCWQQQQQQQQQQQSCHHQAALQLFKQLPLSGAAAHASVPREVLLQMGLGLQLELQHVGAPLDLVLPHQVVEQASSGVQQGGCGAATSQQPLPEDWSAHEQVYPELCVWQQMSAELMRQTHLECSQRGLLLQAATERQQQLLQQALDSCDVLYQAMLASAATQLQQHQAMQRAQTETQALQQENARLKALLEAKQAKLVSTAVELEDQRERMRRGRFHLIHDQVQEARLEIEKRVLRDLEAHVHKARTAAQEASEEREGALLAAVEELAGHDVAAAVMKQLQEYEEAALQQQQAEQQQRRELEQRQQEEDEEGEGVVEGDEGATNAGLSQAQSGVGSASQG